MPNRYTGSIKEMVLGALKDVGGRDYLARQAQQNPVAFLGLVGKVLPLQLANADGGALLIDFRWAPAADAPVIDAVADETKLVADETTSEPEQTTIEWQQPEC